MNNTISYNKQDELPKREDFRFSPNLTWKHSENINSFYRYDFSDTTEETQDTKSQKLTLGMAETSKVLSTSFDIHGEENVISGLQNLNYGGLYSLSYRQPLSIGELQLSYSGSYDRNDQNTDLIQVFEEVTLSGTTAVDLANQFIVINSIIVTNLSGTQEFRKDIDYEIIPIGSRVQIRRISDEI